VSSPITPRLLRRQAEENGPPKTPSPHKQSQRQSPPAIKVYEILHTIRLHTQIWVKTRKLTNSILSLPRQAENNNEKVLFIYNKFGRERADIPFRATAPARFLIQNGRNFLKSSYHRIPPKARLFKKLDILVGHATRGHTLPKRKIASSASTFESRRL